MTISRIRQNFGLYDKRSEPAKYIASHIQLSYREENEVVALYGLLLVAFVVHRYDGSHIRA